MTGPFDDLIPTAPAPGGPPRQDDPFGDLVPSQHSAAQPRFAQPSAPSRGQAFSDSFFDTAYFGLNDEYLGAVAGVQAMARGESFGDAFSRRVAEINARTRAGREAHPFTTTAGTFVGGAATGIPIARGVGVLAEAGRLGNTAQVATRVASGRGPVALAAQTGMGVVGGAVGGGVYGFNATEGDAQRRLEGASDGAKMGAVFGGLAPGAFQGIGTRNTLLRSATGAGLGAVVGPTFLNVDPLTGAAGGAVAGAAGRPLLSRSVDAVRSVRLPPNWMSQTNALAGGFGMRRPPRPPGPERAPDSAVHSIDRALGRERQDVASLAERVGGARASANADRAMGADPIDRRIADVGDEFSAEADAVSNMPGQSFTRAKDISGARAEAMPEQIRTELSSLLGVNRSAAQTLDEVTGMAESANARYQPTLDQALAREHIPALQELMETPDMQRVLAQRYAQHQRRAALARARGEEPPTGYVGRDEDTGRYFLADDATGRELADIKAIIDDELEAAADPRSMSHAGRSDQRINDDYRETYISLLDRLMPGRDGVPGYGAVRAERGSAFEARDILRPNREGIPTIGRTLLSMSPEEIARRMQTFTSRTGRQRNTTEYERGLMQANVVDEVLRRVDDYVSAAGDKVRNAGEVLDKVGLHKRLRAVFGADREAEVTRFLSRTIERAENLRRAAGWTGNSATARRGSRGLDQFMATISNMAGQAAQGNPAGAAVAGGRGVYNALFGRHMERRNDAFGDALFRDLSDPANDPYIDDLIDRLSRIEQDRRARGRNALADGALGAVGGGSALDEGY